MSPPDSSLLGWQVLYLFILAIPISCVAWTITHEEIFKEPREFCKQKSQACRSLVQRKFFYLFTCEYCFSHYVTVFFLWMTRFKLLHDDWRGYVIAFFTLVWVANAYMSLFGRLRVDIRAERAAADVKEKEKEVKEKEVVVKEKQIERIDQELGSTRSNGTFS
jgi:hypothetical protein